MLDYGTEFDFIETGFEERVARRGHRHGGTVAPRDLSRHFKQPKMPKMPAAAGAPPSRNDEDAEKAAAAQNEQARQSRGRRSTIIAGAQPAQTLGGSPNGSQTLLGGSNQAPQNPTV